MKRKLSRILACMMICLVTILFVGCGISRDEFEDGDGVGENSIIEMFGTKVLYRPDNYDYDAGSGAEEGKKNNYYGKYAYLILADLYSLYGITYTEEEGQRDIYFPKEKFHDKDNVGIYSNQEEYIKETSDGKTYYYLPYLYDSIRYQVNTIGMVDDDYYVLGADTSKAWNWSFEYTNPDAYIYTNYILNSNNNVYTKQKTNKINDYLNNLSNYYNIPDLVIEPYQNAFLGDGADVDNEDTYSPFVKALEYVVYSYALDLEPRQITVDKTKSSNGYPYTVNILGYTDVDEALEDIQALFKQLGSYVGLMQRQITKISNYIKTNVIGGDLEEKGGLTIYDNITEIVDGDGNVIGYDFDIRNSSTNDIRHYDRVVDEVVKNVCENVPIGKDGDNDVTVDDRFLASEIVEYAGSTFMQADDSYFPAPGEVSGDAPYMLPLEYQSAVIMLSKPTILSEVRVALKYDADLDGTEEGIYDENKFIDIIVELNYYNNEANRFINLASQQARVYDGPYDWNVKSDHPDTLGFLPDDHGLVRLSIDDNLLGDLVVEGSSNTGVKIGAFKPDIGDGILKTDVGRNNYNGSPIVSEDPLVLVGTTDVRKYYSIIEPSDNELPSSDYTYTTGRLNNKMFAGSNGCDYLEITYKVLKKTGDTKTNYKFYTSLAYVFNTDPK